MTNSELEAIVAAGERATPRPWAVVGANGNYIALAANHADKLAATLLRVRELLKAPLDSGIDCDEFSTTWGERSVDVRLGPDVARELAKLLEG